MFWWGKKREKQKLGEDYVAIDVGSEFVKCLIFRKENNHCFLLGKSRVKHSEGSMRGGMIINIPQALGTINEAYNKASEISKIKPTSLIMSLPGDLVKSLVTTVHYHRNYPESHLDATELKNIVYKVQWKAYEQMREVTAKIKEEAIPDVKLINTSVIDTRVDGYKITNPLGFQGGTVTLSIFNAFAPLVHLGALQSIADEINLDLISVAAGPYALSSSLLANQPDFSAIFIDIGSHITNVIVINEGGLLGIQSFAMGGNMFTKQLAQNLKLSNEKAEEVKIKYVLDLLKKKKLKGQIKEIFKQTALTWVDGVSVALEEFKHLHILPNKIFISGGGSNLEEIKNSLMTKKWSENLPFSKKPYPAIIDLDDLGFFTAQNDIKIDLFDTVVLGLAYLTLESDLKEDVISSMLRRIILSMQN